MDNLSGHLTAKLAEKESYEKSLVDQINIMIKPPKPVSSDEVYIRAMYIVSDQINSQGGCFDPDEMERMMELMIDAPVMVGHKRDSLPVARNFKVDRVEIDGRLWLKSYFYWMKDSHEAEDLKNNIDGGIYKECSVSFLFQLPECSICGEDIRNCRHLPFHEYDLPDGSRGLAHFKYRRVEKVLETSLVFRGAVPDTSITDKLSGLSQSSVTAASAAIEEARDAEKFFSKKGADNFPVERFGLGRAKLRFVKAKMMSPNLTSETVYSFPHQPGIMLRIRSGKGEGQIEIETGYLLPESVCEEIRKRLDGLKDRTLVADVLLYATRGRERLNNMSLLALFGKESSHHRLRLKLYDLIEIEKHQLTDLSYGERIAEAESKINLPGKDTLEIVSVKQVNPSADHDALLEFKACLDQVERYRFGLEVLFEDQSGQISRQIVSSFSQFPVMVSRSTVKNRSHLSCQLEPLDKMAKSFKAIIPRQVGIEQDCLLLVTESSSVSRSAVRQVRPVDILLGVDRDDIELVTEKREAGWLSYDNSDDRLTLVMETAEERLKVVIYHYSEKLFGKGRRFIADVGQLDSKQSLPGSGTSLRMQSYLRQGRLISFRPGKGWPLFDGVLRIMLRPVLIDGRERYLFYADRVNDLQEGL